MTNAERKWLFGVTTDEEFLRDQLSAAQQRVAVLEDALTKIASYGEGPTVTGRFDEPAAARIARAALASTVAQ
jgi:hypothetical protein